MSERHQRLWTLYSRSDLVLSYSVNWTLCGTFLTVWKSRNWLQKGGNNPCQLQILFKIKICDSCWSMEYPRSRPQCCYQILNIDGNMYLLADKPWTASISIINIKCKCQYVFCLQINHGGRHGHWAGRSFCGTRTEDSEWILRYPGRLISISFTPISFSKLPYELFNSWNSKS